MTNYALSLWQIRNKKDTGLLILLVMSISFVSIDAQIRKQKVVESKKLTYVFLAMFVAALFFCVMYCMKKICPRVDMYSPLELDEIRLERAADREGVLSSKIDKMKNKLSNMRKQKTEVQTRRDIATSIEERVHKFNTKGRDIYGDAWEGKNGAVPIRELVKLPDTDVHAMQLEAQAIVTARKEEEKKDLWDLWNKDDDDDVEQGGSKKISSNYSAGTNRANEKNHESTRSIDDKKNKNRAAPPSRLHPQRQ